MNTRRELIRDSLLAATAFRQAASAQTRPRLGLPGLHPCRVVAVSHPALIVSGAYQAQNIAEMMRKGMMELTGAPGWVDAWKVFFEPGDVVAAKVCPAGGRLICSDGSVVNLPALKRRAAAGVTIALKNLSQGFVNNVERSRATPTLNATGTFIPAGLDLPMFRKEAVGPGEFDGSKIHGKRVDLKA